MIQRPCARLICALRSDPNHKFTPILMLADKGILTQEEAAAGAGEVTASGEVDLF